jgi:1-acyl-sn-glycerol-3-phosphate acyltransferase
MKYLIFLLRAVFSVYAFLLFIIIMFLVFPLVVAASFFGKIKGGNFIYGICRLWTDAFLPLCGIFHSNIYEVPHDTNKQFVFVFNHISYLDIPVIMKAIRKQHFRILGKAELAKVPVFGFLYTNAVVLVDRTNVEKRAKSVRQLKSVINKGISVVIAPEGTFNTTHQPLKDFYDGAFKVAIETQTPVKPILFLDTYNRLNYKNIFSLTPGKSRAVFLEEVGVDGMTLKDVQVLKKKVYKLMEKKLIDYKASWIASAE